MFNNFADLDSALYRRHGVLPTEMDDPKDTVLPGMPTPTVKGTPVKGTPINGPPVKNSFDLELQREAVHDPDSQDWVEPPVRFKEFCESKKHMNMLPRGWKEGEEGALSDRQYLDCMAIVTDNPKHMFDPKFRKYTFGALLWGKGSGKDFVCSVIQAYIVYILLCMRNPSEYFGFAPGESLDILNVGKKDAQAYKVYFYKFRARIMNWEWLKERYNILDEGKKFHFAGPNFPTCKIGIKSAEWLDKDVRAYSETSNPEGFEGYNIIFYICDEISGWVSPSERDVAEKILRILRSSQTSRNTKSLCGLGAAISYPRQDDDIMFDFKKESEKPDSKTFYSEGYPWQIRPSRLYDGETFVFNMGTDDAPENVDIPIELQKEFDDNPEDSKGMYLLRPPSVHGQYFEYQERIDSIVHKERGPLFKVETDYINAVDGNGVSIVYVRKRIAGIMREPDPMVDYVIWIDAADVGCDAALSIGHLELARMIEGDVSRDVPVVVLDQTIVAVPDKKLRRIVDIGSLTQCVIAMKRFISVAACWYDHWNSGTGVFDLRQAGILCDRHNLSGTNYDFFKSIIYSDRFQGPDDEDVHKGVAQIKHLTRTRTGNVDTGSKFHKKDIADTWCGITTLLLGDLVNKAFRSGRAPNSINIVSNNRSQGVQGSSYSQGLVNKSPYSTPMNDMGASLIKDHSDMFAGLSQARTKSLHPGGRSSTVKPTPHNPYGRKMPTGIVG